jgi:hypothetical protein
MQVITPRRLGLATVIAVLAALAGCGGSGNASSGNHAAGTAKPSAPPATARSALAPSALLDEAVSAMRAQASVHISCTLSSPLSSPTLKTVELGDIGATSGRVRATEGSVSAANLLLGGVDYMLTNSAALLASNGIPEAESEKLAGKWISLRPGDSYGREENFNYTYSIRTLTLGSQASYLRVTGPLKRTGAAVVDGRNVYGASGTATYYYIAVVNGQPQSPTETVYIAASGAPLPVRVSSHTSDGSGKTCDFSRWNEDLGLTAPAHAVPLTSLPPSTGLTR